MRHYDDGHDHGHWRDHGPGPHGRGLQEEAGPRRARFRHGPDGHHDLEFGGRGGRRGRFGGGGRGPRGRRGDVRAAILALLAERPMHGYEMLQELGERTHDLWHPSPGSLYPALQLLEDQGLVRSMTEDGRRRYELTDEGRAELAKRAEGPPPWETMVRGADQGDVSLRRALKNLAVAVAQVGQAGTPEQKKQVEGLLGDARRKVYLLLAETSSLDEAE